MNNLNDYKKHLTDLDSQIVDLVHEHFNSRKGSPTDLNNKLLKLHNDYVNTQASYKALMDNLDNTKLTSIGIKDNMAWSLWQNHNINYVSDLIAYSQAEFASLDGQGKGKAQKIQNLLESVGLSFRQDN